MKDLQDNLYRYLLAAVFILIAGGSLFYHLVEKWNWLDSYFFVMTTLSTVGYGNMVPHTAAGKIFTTLYIALGIGIFSTFITVTMKRRGEVRKAKEKAKNGK